MVTIAIFVCVCVCVFLGNLPSFGPGFTFPTPLAKAFTLHAPSGSREAIITSHLLGNLLRGAGGCTWEPESGRGPGLAAVHSRLSPLSRPGLQAAWLFASTSQRPDRCAGGERAPGWPGRALPWRRCPQNRLCVDGHPWVLAWPRQSGLAAAEGTAWKAMCPPAPPRPPQLHG